MKLTSALALVITSAALLLAGLSCQKASDMQPAAVPAAQGGIKPVTGDDQPILVVGGSLSLAHDFRAKLDYANGKYSYTTGSAELYKVGSIVISTVDKEDNELDPQIFKPSANAPIKIKIKYGKVFDDTDYLVFSTNLDGSGLYIELQDDNEKPIRRKLDKLFNFLNHPKKNWQTYTIAVTGSQSGPTNPIPVTNGRFNMEIHYCYGSGCP